MEFYTQICTTKEQSERLLALGLKKDTADMFLFKTYDLPQYPFDYTFNQDPSSLVNTRYVPCLKEDIPFVQADCVPAWSLHRMIALCPEYISVDDYADTNYYLTIDTNKVIYQNDYQKWLRFFDEGNVYDRMVNMIEWLMQEKYFNQDFLN